MFTAGRTNYLSDLYSGCEVWGSRNFDTVHCWKNFTQVFCHCDFHLGPIVNMGPFFGGWLHCASKSHDAGCAFRIGLCFGSKNHVDGVRLCSESSRRKVSISCMLRVINTIVNKRCGEVSTLSSSLRGPSLTSKLLTDGVKRADCVCSNSVSDYAFWESRARPSWRELIPQIRYRFLSSLLNS
jgi:hypothetical protein